MSSIDSNDPLQQQINDAEIEGWAVYERHDDRVIMVDRDYGTLGGHVLIALLTVWWTAGLGNVLYAAYRYFFKPDKRVLRADDTQTTDSAAANGANGPTTVRNEFRGNATGGREPTQPSLEPTADPMTDPTPIDADSSRDPDVDPDPDPDPDLRDDSGSSDAA